MKSAATTMDGTHEAALRAEFATASPFAPANLQYVIGVDEAGRGPLAGPVAVAAACVRVAGDAEAVAPLSAPTAKRKRTEDGRCAPSVKAAHPLIDDSKKMPEAARDTVFTDLVGAPPSAHQPSVDGSDYVHWFRTAATCATHTPAAAITMVESDVALGVAVSFVSVDDIDRLNILNASLEGMHRALSALVDALNAPGAAGLERRCGGAPLTPSNTLILFDGPHVPYQVRSDAALAAAKAKRAKAETAAAKKAAKGKTDTSSSATVSLPPIPEPSPFQHFFCVPVIKGDARCPTISLASNFAKVSRDVRMVRLDCDFPEYRFAAHKGYPTADHISVLQRLGATSQHRRSFGPVKAALDIKK